MRLGIQVHAVNLSICSSLTGSCYRLLLTIHTSLHHSPAPRQVHAVLQKLAGHNHVCMCMCLQVHRPVYGPHPPRSLRGQAFYEWAVERAAWRGRTSMEELRNLQQLGELQVGGGWWDGPLYLSGHPVPRRLREPCL